MNLAIDIGNTRSKIGVFDNATMVYSEVIEGELGGRISQLLSDYQIDRTIVSSVTGAGQSVVETIPDSLMLSAETRLPFEIKYLTPETLGKDRLAAVAGAHRAFPNLNVLIIDAGTCVTYDFLSHQGVYCGGNIAPGLQMRLRSMSEYTARLPLVERRHLDHVMGLTTEEALQNGAEKGLLLEIEGYKSRLEEEYGEIEVVITGGDSVYLAEKVKTKIFVRPDLVLQGLNEILRYNVV